MLTKISVLARRVRPFLLPFIVGSLCGVGVAFGIDWWFKQDGHYLIPQSASDWGPWVTVFVSIFGLPTVCISILKYRQDREDRKLQDLAEAQKLVSKSGLSNDVLVSTSGLSHDMDDEPIPEWSEHLTLELNWQGSIALDSAQLVIGFGTSNEKHIGIYRYFKKTVEQSGKEHIAYVNSGLDKLLWKTSGQRFEIGQIQPKQFVRIEMDITDIELQGVDRTQWNRTMFEPRSKPAEGGELVRIEFLNRQGKKFIMYPIIGQVVAGG